MDCKTVRERIEADPARLDQACAEHTEQCAACTAFAERVRNAEWMIHEALRFDVAALKQRVARKPAGRIAKFNQSIRQVGQDVELPLIADLVYVKARSKFEPNGLYSLGDISDVLLRS